MIRQLRTVWPYVKARRWWYVWGLVSLLLTSGMQLIIPQYIKHAVNTLAAGTFTMADLLPDLVGLIAVALLVALGRIGWRFLIQGAARRIEAELRDRLFSHALRLGRSFYQNQKIGDLMALATNDLNAVRMAISMALVAAFDGIFLTVSVLVILLSTQPVLTLLCISPLPLITVLIFVVGRAIGKLFRGVQESFGVLSRQVQEAFSGVKVIQSFVKEGEFGRRFARANDTYQKQNMELMRVSGLLQPAVALLSGCTTVILLRFGGAAVIGGTFGPGDLVATMSYLGLLIWPMLGAGFTVNLLQRGAASMGRINEVLQTKPDIETPEPHQPPPALGAIELRGLTFTYPGRTEPAIHNLDLRLIPGTWLGLTGPIGGGKTTLVAALVRSFPVERGQVLVDGLDVNDYDPDELRRRFAVVPQESFLFSASLGENLAFGIDQADEAAIEAMARVSTIDRDIANFPQGYATEVGERGITLSGGQKQRIALSRALLVDAPILVLDDSFASVDAETERHMLSRIAELRRGRTTIIISHRLSAMAVCDQILVLDEGRLIQSGTHQDLVAQDGFYKKLDRLQRWQGGL